MSKQESEQKPSLDPEDVEAETRLTLSEAGNVIRPRMEAGSYLLGLAVLLITCLLLVPLIQNQVVLVFALLGIAALFVGGLYFFAVVRPRAERKRIQARQEVLTKLDECSDRITETRGCVREAQAPEVKRRLGRICERADKIVAKLEVNEESTLAMATGFEAALNEIHQVICAYVPLVNGQAAGPDEPKTRAETTQLPAIEQTLDELGKQLDRGDLRGFENAAPAFADTLHKMG